MGKPPIGYLRQSVSRRYGAFHTLDPYDAASIALFARMSLQPSSTDKIIYDDAIVSYKRWGIWDLRDEIQAYVGAPSAADALLGWKGFCDGAVSEGTPTWSKTTGYRTSSGSAFHTGFIPSSGVNYALNSCFAGMHGLDDVISVGITDGGTAANRLSLVGKGAGGNPAGGANCGTNVGVTATGTGNRHVAVMRTASNLQRAYVAGAYATGSGETTASASRDNVPFKLGKNGATYYDQNWAMFSAGAAVSATQVSREVDIQRIFEARMGATIPATISTVELTQSASATLPDGSHPVSAGNGMYCTGLAVAPDGTLWIGTGAVTALSTTGVTKLNSAGDTILAEYTAAGLSLPAGSVQGVCVVTGADDNSYTVCFILKVTVDGAYFVKIDQNGSLVSSTLLADSTSNGLAWDAKRSQFIISNDAGSIAWYSTGLVATGKTVDGSSLSEPDHLFHDEQEDVLHVSYGGNGVAGQVARWYVGDTDLRLNNWSMALVLAVEGIAISGTSLLVLSDQATHPGGTVNKNMVKTYALT